MFNVNSKFLAILALIMVFAMIFCAMGVAVFAHDEDDGHDHEDEKNENKEPTWWDNYNQIIGWVLAGIIGVAIVIVSVWWIKSGYKPAKK